MREPMDCPTCGKTLATESGMRQHHAKSHDESLPNRVCKDCGEKFYDAKARRTYCDDCFSNAGSKNGNWKAAEERTDCEICGTEFSYYPSNKDGMYCPQCVAEATGILPKGSDNGSDQITTTCSYCGAEMSVVQSRLETTDRGVFCDQQCHGSWLSENVVGKDHHQWDGGSIQYGRGWWRTRKQALKRDEYRCRICGKTEGQIGRKPDVHHRKRVRDFGHPQDAHTLDNVIALCRSCHRRVESGDVEAPLPPNEG